jgi:hypothetical protein
MNTVITHFHNEEYILPWWINHHKKIFDYGIMINYDSTDRSLEICKQMCPSHWKIVNSVNETFEPYTNDTEVKVHEQSVDGFKITLTSTEFLLIPCSLNTINQFIIDRRLEYLKTWGVCMVDADTHILPTHDRSLIEQKHHGMITGYSSPLSLTLNPTHGWYPDSFNYLYGRFYHNQPFGKYTDGRHAVHSHKVINVGDIFTLKYKYCPWNETYINRLKDYEILKNKVDPASYINTDNQHDEMYKHYLNDAHDLNNNHSFKAAFHYTLGL